MSRIGFVLYWYTFETLRRANLLRHLLELLLRAQFFLRLSFGALPIVLIITGLHISAEVSKDRNRAVTHKGAFDESSSRPFIQT